MDIRNLLYDNNTTPLPERGNLLISDPLMTEPHFSRSVVMILDVTKEQGHLGLALNKPTALTLNDLIPDWDKGRDLPVYCGGPVDMQRLFLLHSLGQEFPGSEEVIPGIYVGGNVDDIISYVNAGGETTGKMRFFLGYSGWDPNQLQGEIIRHSWAVNPHPDGKMLLLGEGDPYWREEVKALGDRYRSWLVVPQDPSMN